MIVLGDASVVGPAQPGSTADFVAPEHDPLAAAPSRSALIAAERRKGRPGRLLRSTLSLILLAAAVALLWPASWGGITGLTVVQGNSMLPTYRTGDLVVSIRQPGYAVGDIVSFTVPEGQAGAGGRVIHRVLSVEQGADPVYRTKGDGNATPDEWRITGADVMGRALLQLPGVGGWFGGDAQWVLLAGFAGLAVTVLLWPSGKGDSRSASPRREGRDR